MSTRAPRSYPSSSSNFITTYNAEKQMAERMQNDAHRAELLNALRMQRAQLIKNGALESAVPNIHDHMSPTDIARANSRIQGMLQAQSNRTPTTAATKPAAPAAAAPDTTGAANGVRAAGNAAASALTGIPMPDAPASPGAAPTPVPGGDGKNALEHAMSTIPFHNGMTADVRQTGAGFVTTVPSESGPREVAVTPTFEQIMSSKTGGKWAGMTPAQRAQWLRSNPAPSLAGTQMDGEVTDTGAGAFDSRGTRVLGQKTLQTGPGTDRTPGGDRRTTDAYEYDPRMDSQSPADIARRYGDKTGGSIKYVPPTPGQAAPQPPVPGFAPGSAIMGGVIGATDATGAAGPTGQPPTQAATPLTPLSIPPHPGMGDLKAAEAAGTPPAVGDLAGPPMPSTGAEMLNQANAAKANADALRRSANAADAAAQKDQADKEKAKQIMQEPPNPTDKEMRENPNYWSTGPMFGANTTPTPLGSTSMNESPLDNFSTSPADAQFKKRLTTPGEIV